MGTVVENKGLPACPVETTLQLIGNKWKIFVLRELLPGVKRFGELQRAIPGISQKVLTQNLRAMEKDGLLVREVFAEVPPRVEYRLSELGGTLRPVVATLWEWGIQYKEKCENEPCQPQPLFEPQRHRGTENRTTTTRTAKPLF